MIIVVLSVLFIVIFVLVGFLAKTLYDNYPKKINASFMEDDDSKINVVQPTVLVDNQKRKVQVDDDSYVESPTISQSQTEMFGASVAVNGKYVAVSAPGHGVDTNNNNASGCVYIYRRDRKNEHFRTIYPPAEYDGQFFGKRIEFNSSDTLIVTDNNEKVYKIKIK